MNKVSINNVWLVIIPVMCLLGFVIFPQVQNIFSNFNNQEKEYFENVYKLDSLKQIRTPSLSVKNKIESQEILVSGQKLSIYKQKYNYYKHGGAVIVVFLVLLLIFGSAYISKQKKVSSNNKTITFNYKNYLEDYLGQKISWEAVKNSGSNFANSSLKKTKFGYKIRSSNYMKYIGWAFVFISVNSIFWTLLDAFEFSQEPIGLFKIASLVFSSGGLFVLPGIFLLFGFSANKIYIDSSQHKLKINNLLLNFNQLYAMQLLQKFVEGNRAGGYYCYELNVVTKDGTRYNLLNHGDKEVMLSDMVKLSAIFKLPVWNANVV